MSILTFFDEVKQLYLSGKLGSGDVYKVLDLMEEREIYLINAKMLFEGFDELFTGINWQSTLGRMDIEIQKSSFYNRLTCKYKFYDKAGKVMEDVYSTEYQMKELLAFVNYGNELDSNIIMRCISPKLWENFEQFGIQVTVNEEEVGANKQILLN